MTCFSQYLPPCSLAHQKAATSLCPVPSTFSVIGPAWVTAVVCPSVLSPLQYCHGYSAHILPYILSIHRRACTGTTMYSQRCGKRAWNQNFVSFPTSVGCMKIVGNQISIWPCYLGISYHGMLDFCLQPLNEWSYFCKTWPSVTWFLQRVKGNNRGSLRCWPCSAAQRGSLGPSMRGHHFQQKLSLKLKNKGVISNSSGWRGKQIISPNKTNKALGLKFLGCGWSKPHWRTVSEVAFLAASTTGTSMYSSLTERGEEHLEKLLSFLGTKNWPKSKIADCNHENC